MTAKKGKGKSKEARKQVLGWDESERTMMQEDRKKWKHESSGIRLVRSKSCAFKRKEDFSSLSAL